MINQKLELGELDEKGSALSIKKERESMNRDMRTFGACLMGSICRAVGRIRSEETQKGFRISITLLQETGTFISGNSDCFLNTN